jgi:hypothetical protein
MNCCHQLSRSTIDINKKKWRFSFQNRTTFFYGTTVQCTLSNWPLSSFCLDMCTSGYYAAALNMYYYPLLSIADTCCNFTSMLNSSMHGTYSYRCFTSKLSRPIAFHWCPENDGVNGSVENMFNLRASTNALYLIIVTYNLNGHWKGIGVKCPEHIITMFAIWHTLQGVLS